MKKIICTRLFALSVLFKASAGILLGLLFYKHYQYGDTISYYQSALEISATDWTSFWSEVFEPTITSDPVRAIYFTRILAVLLYFTQSDYWLTSVYYSIFSLFGTFYFIKQLSNWQKSYVLPATFAFLLLPSVVFWSSGIVKESMAFGGMLLIIGVYLKYKSNRYPSISDGLLLGFGILILAMLKYYVLGVLLPVLMFLVIYDQLDKRRWLFAGIWKNVSLLIPLMVLPTYFFLSWLHPNFDIAVFGEILQIAHLEMIENSKLQNAIPVLHWFPHDLANQVFNVFYFVFSGIFRPLLPENIAFPGVFSSVENLIIMTLLIWKIFTLKRTNAVSVEAFALLAYVAVLAFFLTYSLPNLGALARFKVYYLPFFVFYILVNHPLIAKIKTWWSSSTMNHND